MNILHVIPSIDPQSGGPARAVRRYANLSASFANIMIAATNEGLETLPIHNRNEHLQIDQKIDVRLFNYVGTHSYKYSQDLRTWLNSNIADFDMVHIHAAFSIMSTLTAGICRRKSVDYIFRPLGTLSDFSMSDGSVMAKKIYFRLLEKRSLEGAKAIHVTSRAEKKSVQKKIDKNTPIAVIGIPEELKKYPKRTKADDRLRIGFLSRIHPKKNLEAVFEALAKFHLPVHCTIAGSGKQHYVDNLTQLISQLNIEDSVEWIGFIADEEKSEFFDNIDFLILPSRHENFGIAVIEALSYGRPVIISDNVDTASYVQSYKCGIITTQSTGSIVKALTTAESMTNKHYQEMSRSAVSLVEENFSFSAIKKKLRNLYEC